MTDEKNTPPEAAASPPPTIAPRKAVPRPPGPPAAGEQISTDHFALPEVDLDSLSEVPDFAGITSTPVTDAPALGAFRHSGGPTTAVPTPPQLSDSHDDEPEESSMAAVGAKVKGWAGSAIESVKSIATPKEKDPEVEESEQGASATSAGSGAAFGAAPRPVTPRSPSEPAEDRAADTAARPAGAPRKVRLAIARLDPWSVMKLSFLMSVALGIMLVVATWVFWYALNDLGVFTSIDELIGGIVGQESEDLDILQYLARDKVMSLATLIAVVDVVLLTALATIGAFLYNIVAALVGGIHMTMSDD